MNTTKTLAITQFISGIKAEAVRRIHDGAIALIITRPAGNGMVDIHQVPFMSADKGMQAYYDVVKSIRKMEDELMLGKRPEVV